jgi:hypothetical protein
MTTVQKMKNRPGWWCTPVIPLLRTGTVAQVVECLPSKRCGPEFKPPYCTKDKKKNKCIDKEVEELELLCFVGGNGK